MRAGRDKEFLSIMRKRTISYKKIRDICTEKVPCILIFDMVIS